MAKSNGNWLNRVTTQSSALKWGTGANPVHGYATEGPNLVTQAKLVAPNYAAGASMDEVIPIEETDSAYYLGELGESAPWAGTGTEAEQQDAWTPDNDLAEALWGYSDDAGTSDRPPMNATTEEFRGNTELFRNAEYPAWGEHNLPAGTEIRAQNHGAEVSKRAKNRPTETVSTGWRNKVHNIVEMEAKTSDEAQVFMQTSMTQRNKVREGSQSSGTADEHHTPIASRTKGMRIKVYSGGVRHYDMFPRQADQRIRPWWSRTAGTGPQAWMDDNEPRSPQPLERRVPEDPYQGVVVPAGEGTTGGNNWGYVSEDVIPYA